MKITLFSRQAPVSRAGGTTLRAVAAAGLLLATGTAASRADILYEGNLQNATILKFTSASNASAFANSGSGLNGPYGLAFDSARNLTVSSNGTNSILKFTLGGASSVFVASGAYGLNSPKGEAYDYLGNLYVANAGTNSILKFSPSGVGTTFATGVSGVFGLAFDPTGNLYASATNTIMKFTTAGTGSVFASGLNTPTGLAFDTTGNLYAASYNGNTITKFTTAGTASTFASSGLTFPVGLAFDSVGNLYAANQGNSSIEKYTSAGVGSVFVSANGVNVPSDFAFTDDAGAPLLVAIAPVPEPATWAAGALTVLAAGLALRRRA